MLRSNCRWFYGLAIAAAMLAAPALIPAQQDPGKPESRPVRVEISVVRVDFDSKHPMGSQVSTEDIQGAMKDGGVVAISKLLEKEGKVQLAFRTEGSGFTDDGTIRAFLGQEKPFITTLETKKGEGVSKTTTQSTISSGITADYAVTKDGEDGWRVTYKIDYDAAAPEEQEGATVVGRIRSQVSGRAALPSGGGLHVGRVTGDGSKGPYELIAISKVTVD